MSRRPVQLSPMIARQHPFTSDTRVKSSDSNARRESSVLRDYFFVTQKETSDVLYSDDHSLSTAASHTELRSVDSGPSCAVKRLDGHPLNDRVCVFGRTLCCIFQPHIRHCHCLTIRSRWKGLSLRDSPHSWVSLSPSSASLSLSSVSLRSPSSSSSSETVAAALPG